MSQLLADYIYHKNSFSHSLCEDIVSTYKEEIFNRYKNSKDTRHLGELQISDHEIIDKKNSYVRKKIEQEIFNFIGFLIKDYEKHVGHDNIHIQEDIGYSLRQMTVGDYYAEHDDEGVGQTARSRRLTVSICLNEDYEGGDFTFFKETKIYKLKKGDVLVFPSSFMFPHGVQKITKGTRYQLLTWLK
jgi:Rps23 Pro-64 3,4-dihydroxylase Tpa1-like proline 4-hydroxylase